MIGTDTLEKHVALYESQLIRRFHSQSHRSGVRIVMEQVGGSVYQTNVNIVKVQDLPALDE